MNKILVLGGCGFIGSHVVDLFLKQNYAVSVIDNLSTGKIHNKPKKATFYRMDLKDKKKLEKVIFREKPAVISHHASSLVGVQESIRNPLKAFIDIEITVNIIESALKHKVKHIIFASSANVYAKESGLPINEKSVIEPLSPYGITKLATEAYCNYISKCFGIKITIFRYFNVYGPRQRVGKREGIIPILITSLLANKKIIIFGSGNQTRDFVYVKDIAYANFLAAKNQAAETFNVGSGKRVSIKTLVHTIETLLGEKAKSDHKKIFTEIDHSFADISKIQHKLGWKPQTNLMDGLKKTIDFYKTIQNQS